ncbi:MAG: DUF86 domain-containing protein [Thermoplasmatota archaeon]
MDAARLSRYLMKVDHARERLSQASEWIGLGRKDVVHRLAAYKAFQESVEAVSDLLAMALIDSGQPPTDDYRNVERAAATGLITAALAPALAEATGLRNRLVHEYDTLDDARVREAMPRLEPQVRQAIQEVERWARSKM